MTTLSLTKSGCYRMTTLAWNESLPLMPTARYGANFLIVVAGSVNVGHSSNTVEIYDGKQWMTLSRPPKKFYTPWSTCLNGFCFLLQRNRSVLYTSIQSLINDTTNGWKKLPDIPPTASVFCSTIFAGTLLVVGGSIHMYYPLAQQWVSLPNYDSMPIEYSTCVAPLSSQELIVIGIKSDEGSQGSFKYTKAPL